MREIRREVTPQAAALFQKVREMGLPGVIDKKTARRIHREAWKSYLKDMQDLKGTPEDSTLVVPHELMHMKF